MGRRTRSIEEEDEHEVVKEERENLLLLCRIGCMMMKMLNTIIIEDRKKHVAFINIAATCLQCRFMHLNE